jgi:uncharacterized protein
MTVDPDLGFGLLSPEDHDKMEQIITERSDGSYGMPALHGMLTASVIGPEPVPMDWILQTVLSSPESEAIGFDDFPEYGWIAGRIEELHRRIGLVFQEGPEMFQLLVYMPNLKEGDTTPDSQTWCNGFVEGMAYNREKWVPLFASSLGFERIAPIMMTSDPDEWEKKDALNPFAELAPRELGDALKLAVLATYDFWSRYEPNPNPIRTASVPGRNAPCPCGSGKKYKHCCGRAV